MGKHLLILADPYGKPSFAPRLRYLCDYLTRKGWDLDVYTEQWDELCFEHNYPITEVQLYKGQRGSLLHGIDWAIKAAAGLLFDWKDNAFAREVKRQTAKRQYDAVLCTTFSTFPLPAALEVAREKHIPLYCDIRDLDEQVGGAQYQSHRSWWTKAFRTWYSRVNIRRRNRILKQAKAITTVSPWHVDFLKKINPQTSLIYNGFNPQIHFFEPVRTEQFIISYIGRLYEQHSQDPTLLFEAISRLKDEMPELLFTVHTDEKGRETLRQLVRQYGIADRAEINGYVSIDVVPGLYRESSICVVLSNKAYGAGPKGMMTTKFFEIVGTEKPLLLVRSDEAHLEAAIRETNAGAAARTTDEAIAFIREVYQQWKVQGYTHQAVNKAAVQLFNREAESAQFEQLLLK